MVLLSFTAGGSQIPNDDELQNPRIDRAHTSPPRVGQAVRSTLLLVARAALLLPACSAIFDASNSASGDVGPSDERDGGDSVDPDGDLGVDAEADGALGGRDVAPRGAELFALCEQDEPTNCLQLGPGNWALDTDTGELRDPGGLIANVDALASPDVHGREVLVVLASEILIDGNLSLFGSRPVVFASWSILRVGSAIDVSGNGTDRIGAGANHQDCGTSSGQPGELDVVTGTTIGGGGGGASNAGRGGVGSFGTLQPGTADGGSSGARFIDTRLLLGGCAGGADGGSGASGANSVAANGTDGLPGRIDGEAALEAAGAAEASNGGAGSSISDLDASDGEKIGSQGGGGGGGAGRIVVSADTFSKGVDTIVSPAPEDF